MITRVPSKTRTAVQCSFCALTFCRSTKNILGTQALPYFPPVQNIIRALSLSLSRPRIFSPDFLGN